MEKEPAATSPEAGHIPAESRTGMPTVESPRDSAQKPRAQNVESSISAPEGPKRLELDGDAGTPTAGSDPKSPEKTKVSNGAGAVKGKETGPGKPAARTVPKTTTKSGLPPLSTSAANKTASKPTKSPINAQTPKTRSPTTASSQTPAKTATPKPAAKTTKSTLGSSLNKKPASLAPSPVITGSTKPKAKSPTRPIALPERLTTHTAASGSKLGNARAQSQTRERGPTPASRSSSRVRVPAPTSAPKTATSNLKRQNSTNNRPRPSLGAPVKQPAKDHPPTKKEKEVDEGFLARMMRPTAASASKTAEKVVTSPPRKSSATPGPAAKRSVSKPRSLSKPPTKKPATKSAAPSAATTPKQSRASSAAAKAEPVAKAEEAVEVSKTTDDELPLPVVTETPQEAAKPVEEATEVTHEASASPSEPEAVVAAPQTPTSDIHEVKGETPAQETEAAHSSSAEAADAIEADIEAWEEEKSASTPEPKPTSDS